MCFWGQKGKAKRWQPWSFGTECCSLRCPPLAQEHGVKGDAEGSLQAWVYYEVSATGDRPSGVYRRRCSEQGRCQHFWTIEESVTGRPMGFQSLGEQVRVLRRRLEARLGIKVRGLHPLIAWLVVHTADALSRCAPMEQQAMKA